MERLRELIGAAGEADVGHALGDEIRAAGDRALTGDLPCRDHRARTRETELQARVAERRVHHEVRKEERVGSAARE